MRASVSPTDRGPGLLPWLVSLGAAVAVLGPALGPGALLHHDLVGVPEITVGPRLLGVSPELARAVPSDLLLVVLGGLVGAGTAVRIVLLATLVLAGGGAARLLPLGRWGGCAAALAAVWNPWVGERIGIGQWAVLLGYAALPWVLRAATDVAAGRRGAVALTLALCGASLGGPPAWLLASLGAATAYLVSWWRSGPQRSHPALGASFVVLLAALALPWVGPTVLAGATPVSDVDGVEVFRPGADTPLGTALSVLTGGGVWNDQVGVPGRDSVVGALGGLVLTGCGVAGLWLTRRVRAWPAYLVAACVGLLLTALTLVPGGGDVLAALPGGGLLRDGSRQSAAWVVLVATGFGVLVDRLATARLRLAAGLLALLPVGVLPGLALGLSGQLRPVALPADLVTAAARTGDDAVVVLPFEAYRRYPWNHATPVLDPVPRLARGPVVLNDDLLVERDGVRHRVSGESRAATDVEQMLRGPRPAQGLARLGVRWVLVDAPGASVPAGLRPVSTGEHVRLYAVPGAARTVPERWLPPVAPVVLLDLTALAVALVGGGLARWRDARLPG